MDRWADKSQMTSQEPCNSAGVRSFMDDIECGRTQDEARSGHPVAVGAPLQTLQKKKKKNVELLCRTAE